jgi:hypothetical protein
MGRDFAVFYGVHKMNKSFLRVGGVVASLGLLASSAHAALDVTAATTGITDATTAVVAVLGAMIVMGAAFFGLKKIKALIGG